MDPLIFTRRLIGSPRLREGSREGLGERGEDGFGPETLIHCYLKDIFICLQDKESNPLPLW